MSVGEGRDPTGAMSRADGVPRAVPDRGAAIGTDATIAPPPSGGDATMAAPLAPALTPAATPRPAVRGPADETSPAMFPPATGDGATMAAPPLARGPRDQTVPAPHPGAAVAETMIGSVAAPAGGAGRSREGDSTLPPAAGYADGDLTSFVQVDPASYGIGQEIARGGMGRILAARDRRLRRDVVIKVTRDDGAADPRFEREALITARLQHPSIVRVYEAGLLGDARAFYTMERVRGRSLEAVILATSTVRERIALLPHAIAVADAIAYAHSEGVVHRDLKPANVLVGPFGETVVIDWGLAKDLRAAESSRDPSLARPRHDSHPGDGDLTMDGSVLGTPAYMAPEQARGEPVGPSCDVYALGALLYAMFSATAPFRASTGSEVLEMVVAGKLVPIRERVPELPPELASIVERAMAHDPARRLPRATDLADELRRYAAGQLVASHTYSFGTLVRRWLARHRATVAVGATALVLMAALGSLAVVNIVRERNAAQAARAEAELARGDALKAQGVAERRADDLIVDQARATLPLDPSRAVGWLKQLSAPRIASAEAHDLAALADRAGLAHELVGHTDRVQHVEVAPDGHHVASGSDDATVRWWSLDDAEVKILRGQVGAIQAIAISPDGSRVASTGTKGEVWLWSPRKDVTKVLRGHAERVRSLAFSPDGKSLASVGEDGMVWLWSVATGEGKLLLHHSHALRPVAWTPDSRQILIGTADGSLGFVDPHTGATKLMAAHDDGIRVIAASPDGARIATGTENGAVLVWDAAGVMQTRLPPHTQMTRSVAFTPDGTRLVTAGGDDVVRVDTVATGASIELRGNTSAIKLAVISHDGRWVASAGLDGDARVWPIEGGPPRVLIGHAASVKDVGFSRDDTELVSASEDGRIRVWPLNGHPPPPSGPALRAWMTAATNVEVRPPKLTPAAAP